MVIIFEKGSLISGVPEEKKYSFTNKEALMYVEEVFSPDLIKVKIIAHESCSGVLGNYYTVESGCFLKTTVDDYFKQYPNANKVEDFDQYIGGSDEKSEAANETVNKFKLSDAQRDELYEEMRGLLDTYGYDPTKEGCDRIIDTWQENKGDLILLMSKHPNYNGKYQIAFDSDFEREINPEEVRKFFNYVEAWGEENRDKFLVKKLIGPFSYLECDQIRNRMSKIISCLKEIESNGGVVSQDYLRSCLSEHRKFDNICEQFIRGAMWGRCTRYCDDFYTAESYKEYRDRFGDILYYLSKYHSQFLDEKIVDDLNSLFPDLKATVGQKTSRIVNKYCKFIGIDKDPEYQKKYAAYADAVNPLMVKRHTVISCHPIDYLTMSFGNSWASCHTIDKFNVRGKNNGYSGCYSGGTLSYMLDGTSAVFYTVDKSYSGDRIELEPKITRNMFHIGQDKIIQGRVYPQSSDEYENIYQINREIVQKVISDCMGKPNLWTIIKGTSECEKVVDSEGVHYKDYLNYDNCNVSYLRNPDNMRNLNKIVVGHTAICPCCGNNHKYEEAIECRDCYVA